MPLNRQKSLLRTTSGVATAIVVGALLVTPTAAQAEPSTPAQASPQQLGKQGAVSAPDAALGAGWKKSTDVMVTGAGDTDGFHLYIAREKDAFAWSTLATLTASALDLGTWTGEVCVTGSGRYAVAVYAPSIAANKPNLVMAGALAAVVDTQTGQATTVATGVQLAYFNPGCGPNDRVLLTRALGREGEETDLLTIDAATATVTTTKRIKAQLTNPVAGSDGDYGISGSRLVKIEKTGSLTPVGTPRGQAFSVQATARHGIDIASITGETVTVQRFAGTSVTELGSGTRGRLQLLSLRGGQSAVVGDTTKVKDAPELAKLTSDRRVRSVSAQGHLLAQTILPRQAADAGASPLSPVDRARAGQVEITTRATRSGRAATGIITTGDAPTLNAIPAASETVTTLATVPTPKCAVPRNDPQIQAFQPGPKMVEWAVDLAVHGQLLVQRPANYLKTGQPAYQPQLMFPIHGVVTGGRVPAQVMLGIVAQETNMSQASWHAVPGDTGNPLIANYYGSSSVNVIDYTKSDCGYGISQVTTGMTTGSTVYTPTQRVAIATDYAANIAAGMNILIDKWNQIYNDPAGKSSVNTGNAVYIENWYLAIWAYNSGYYPSTDKAANGGHWGVGWLNNPANPSYPADREPFLRASYADAATPSHWSYPERIFGWIETPQLKGSDGHNAYLEATYGSASNGQISFPSDRASNYIFCSSTNACNPAVPTNPCPSVSSACWWHGSAQFASCPDECSTEKLNAAMGDAEPAPERVYDRDCSTFT